jgi:adenine-specific DNA-methyltransferase
VFEAVCEHWQQWLTDRPGERKKKWCWVDEKTGDVHLTMALKRQILTSNVFGVDLDPGAVEVTQLSLYLKMLENENRNTLQRQRELLPDDDDPLLPPLENNIQCGNSLIASDFSMIPDDLVRVNAQDWDVGFKAIMKSGGFDAVVGNPPYGAVLSEDETKYLRNQFQSAEYQIDTYPIFAERSHSLLKQGAYFGVIIPSAWVASEYNIKFRQFLCASLQPINIVIAPKDVFEDATVETVVMTCRKGMKSAGEVEIERWDITPRKNYLLSFSRITNDRANIFPIYREPQVDKLIAKIAGANGRFGQVSEAVWGIKVYQKGKGKPPQKGSESTSRCFHAESKKKSTHRKLVGGSEVRRFDFDWNGGWVDYGIWLAEPRTPDWFQGERVLIREVTANGCIQASITDEPFVFSNSVDGLRLKPNAKVALKFLLALLNSRLLSFYNLHTSANAFKGAFPKVLIKDLLAFPLPPIENNKSRHDKLVLLVEKMLGLMPKLRAATAERERATLQNAVTATDQQIDALVYELYGLTPAEIKLVEGNA